jgi:hypothetical protein
MPGYKRSMYTAPEPTEETPDLSERFFMPTMEEILMLIVVMALFFLRKQMTQMTYAAALLALVGLYVYRRVEKVEKYCAKCMM